MAHFIIFGIAVTVERIPQWKREALKNLAKSQRPAHAPIRTKRLPDFL